MAHTLTFTTTDTGRVYETLSPLITGLQGPLPDLRLPALQELQLNTNQFTGGLEPLRACKALQELRMNRNQFTGGLEPLRGFTVLHTLDLDQNKLTGGLEPLRGCTALQELSLNNMTN